MWKKSIYVTLGRQKKKLLSFILKENFLLTCTVNWIIKKEEPFRRPGMTRK